MSALAELMLICGVSMFGGLILGLALELLVGADRPLGWAWLQTELVKTSVLVSLGLSAVASLNLLIR